MLIGIDARMYGPNVGGGGLGRYVEQLILELQKIENNDRYVLFLKKNNFDDCKITKENFLKKTTNIHWYTLKEQLSLGKIIDDQKLDLIHFPHWNVPLNIKTPFVVTIHDLILLEEPYSSRTTTRNKLVHKIKYLAYKKVLKHAITKSKHIIAISQYTKDSILKHFPNIASEKITVIYQGVTKLNTLEEKTSEIKVPDNYLLYIGNAYPHKNLETLIKSFVDISKINPELHLVLAGKNDIFYERLNNFIKKQNTVMDKIKIIPNPTDAEIAGLYKKAEIYVFPSRIEGFGLPALEAMQFKVPVASSNTGALPEILQDAAIFFSPTNKEDITTKINELLNNTNLQNSLINKGNIRIKMFSWSKTAEQTNRIYKTCAN